MREREGGEREEGEREGGKREGGEREGGERVLSICVCVPVRERGVCERERDERMIRHFSSFVRNVTQLAWDSNSEPPIKLRFGADAIVRFSDVADAPP